MLTCICDLTYCYNLGAPFLLGPTPGKRLSPDCEIKILIKETDNHERTTALHFQVTLKMIN